MGLSIGLAASHADPSTNAVLVSSALVDQLMEEARTNNPALRAADFRTVAASFNSDAVRAWEDPMFMIGGSLFSSRGFSASEEGDLTYGVEQKLPLWGRPKLTRRLAETEFSVRRADADLRYQQLRRDLIKALFTTALASQVVDVGEQDLAWLDTTEKAVESRYRSGQAAIADTLQVQNEFARRRETLLTDRQRLGHAYIFLDRLVNRNTQTEWPRLRMPAPMPSVAFSEQMVALAMANEPRLKVMQQEIKQAEAMAELTRRTRLPDVSLGVEGKQFSGDGGFRAGMFKLSFSIPWGNARKYRSDYYREKAKQKAAELESQDQELMVREQLHHLAIEIDGLGRDASLYDHEILPRAAQALSSRLADWEAGRGSFRDVLDARRMLLESQLLAARAVSEHYQMVADLVLWIGLPELEALTRFQPPTGSGSNAHP